MVFEVNFIDMAIIIIYDTQPNKGILKQNVKSTDFIYSYYFQFIQLS